MLNAHAHFGGGNGRRAAAGGPVPGRNVLWAEIVAAQSAHATAAARQLQASKWSQYREMKAGSASMVYLARSKIQVRCLILHVQLYCMYSTAVQYTVLQYTTLFQYSTVLQYITVLQYSTVLYYSTLHYFSIVQCFSTLLQYSTVLQYSTTIRYSILQCFSTVQYSTQ